MVEAGEQGDKLESLQPQQTGAEEHGSSEQLGLESAEKTRGSKPESLYSPKQKPKHRCRNEQLRLDAAGHTLEHTPKDVLLCKPASTGLGGVPPKTGKLGETQSSGTRA